MFSKGKRWRIWEIACADSPNFTFQINNVHYKESKTSMSLPKFTHQKLLMGNSPVFLRQTFALYGN